MKSNSTHFSEMLLPYIDNELSEESRKELENELAKNEQLQSQLNNLILSTSVIRNYGLRTRINKLHTEMMAELKSTTSHQAVSNFNSFKFYSFRIAASLILLSFLYIVYLYLTVRSESILMDKYTPYQMSVTRGEENEIIKSLYHENDYSKIINDISLLANPTTSDLFLTGQAYFAIQNYHQAGEYFEKAIQQNMLEKTKIYQDDVEYYMALCNIKNNEIGKAYKTFKSIRSNKQHLYKDKISYAELIKLKILISK